MSAELPAAPKGQTRHPWDWYVEQEWVTHRLLDCAPIERNVTILDPCCGGGNIVRALRDRGHEAYGMDLFDRGSPHFLGTHDFIGAERTLLEAHPQLSIIFNPPFSCQDGMLRRGLAERFIRRALQVATCQVAALLPLKWLSSSGRVDLFTSEATAPIGAWILTERPSMPPGDQIEALGDSAFDRGKVDYMWLLWDKRRRPQQDQAGSIFVPTYWIQPRVMKARQLSLAA
jgi:hypothetical protein